MIYATVTLLAVLALASSKIYFHEDFNDEGWRQRWSVPTEWKSKSDLGEWEWTAGEWHADATNKGIKTSQDAKFYGLSAPLSEHFSNAGKDLVVQFTVKHEQDLDCGGAYIKLLGDIDATKFGGDTPYQIMFGPDICGPSNRRTHVIFNYPPKGENLLVKEDVKVETDRQSHVYTLHVKPDNTFEVFIDQESVRKGTLEDGWDFLLPREIKDPAVSKPADWVDARRIADPSDSKPEGWDDVPKEIPDPDAQKPQDWDDEEDGDWEPPLVDNPEYKGPWKPRMIDNPDYKGEWVHPLIPNPDFVEDAALHQRCKDCARVGFELWQVKSGTLFDDILVTDSLAEAQTHSAQTLANRAAEKAAFDKREDALRAERAAQSADEEDAEEAGDDHDEL